MSIKPKDLKELLKEDESLLVPVTYDEFKRSVNNILIDGYKDYPDTCKQIHNLLNKEE